MKKGTQEADDALKLSVENRLKLVVDLQPSSDEEEEEEMDVEGMYCSDVLVCCVIVWLTVFTL